VTAYRRTEQTLATLRKIMECRPPPAEILVHVDGNQTECAAAIRREFPSVQVVVSESNVGPGGGRNKLVAAASNDIVASFDDDSYPVDSDYFARVCEVFLRRPDAAVVASQITERGNPIPAALSLIRPEVHFGGGGVAYRRNDFLDSGGHVPLAIAYGMEEVDLCIRLTNQGKKIYFSPWLRVFHDSDLSHHASAAVTAASVQNLALLVYLRYPLRYWPYGALQVLNRIAWLIRARRFQGLVPGVLGILVHVWRYRMFRAPVSPRALSRFLRARRQPAPLKSLRGSD
jgi:GT2 family glycosyltransferase